MPIEFPTPSYVGELVTSPNGARWRWNGYAWDTINLQFGGDYQKPWLLFRNSDKISSYTSFALVMNDAKYGDTIYLAGSVNEVYNLSGPILIKDGVTINLNGNTFIYTRGSSNTTTRAFQISDSGRKSYVQGEPRDITLRTGDRIPTKIKIQNGTIRCVGSVTPGNFRIFDVNSQDGVDIDFTDLVCIMETSQNVPTHALYVDGNSFIQDFNIDGENFSSIKGGYFYNFGSHPNSTGAWIITGYSSFIQDYAFYQISDMFGYSENGVGLQFDVTVSFI